MKAAKPKLSSTRAKFIQKLHNAITLHDGPVVQWTLNQESFVVLQPETFCEVVLPTFCSHTSFASFERQLHFYSFQRMGQYETKSSGKRFKKGTPIKYVHPLFKKNTTLEVLQSIRRRTRSNNEEQKLIKQIEKSKSLALQQRIQLIRYQNIARALEDEIHIREEALLKQQQVEQEHRRKHGQKHGQKHGIKHGQNTGQKQKPVKQKAKEEMYEQKPTKKRKKSNPSVFHSSVLHSSMLNSAVLNLSGFRASASHSSPIMTTTSSESNSSVGTSNNNGSNEFNFMIDDLDSSNLHSAPVDVTTSESVVFPPKPNDEFKFLLDDDDFNFSNNDLLNLDIDTNRVEEHYWNEINVMSSS